MGKTHRSGIFRCLNNMTPLFAINDRVSLRSAYAEFFRKLSCEYASRRVPNSYFSHLRFYKFGRGAFLTLLILVPSLFLHVLAVVFVCADEQVVRVDANSVITLMTDEHPIGDRAVSVNPRKSVTLPPFSALPIGMPESVSISVFSTSPMPAFVRGLDCYLSPESLIGWGKVSLPSPCCSSSSHRLIQESHNTA